MTSGINEASRDYERMRVQESEQFGKQARGEIEQELDHLDLLSQSQAEMLEALTIRLDPVMAASITTESHEPREPTKKEAGSGLGRRLQLLSNRLEESNQVLQRLRENCQL